jgi:hypothetical protein
MLPTNQTNSTLLSLPKLRIGMLFKNKSIIMIVNTLTQFMHLFFNQFCLLNLEKYRNKYIVLQNKY